jgi:CysZ protein
LFVLKAFFIGFNFVDYSLERNMVPIGRSWKYAIANPLMMMAFGALFSLLFMLPLIGAMLAPFLTTIFATVYFLRKGKEINIIK